MGEELVWACKNGDLDQVKAIVDKPVRKERCIYNETACCLWVCEVFCDI